jgi:hypothetical protein
MGLDMYLEQRVYIGANYEHNNVTGSIDLKRDGKPINIPLNKVSEIVLRVGYWRKANQIHKWFVDNIQDGEDDCREYHVSEEQLTELYNICKIVMKNKKLAPELLPTQEGFFFGSYEYDDYYFEDIKHTMEILKPIANGELTGDFYYSSSW